MPAEFFPELQTILKEVFTKRHNFYRLKYQSAGIDRKSLALFNKETFLKLPLTTFNELAKSPYKNRCLEEKKGLNKLVFSKEADRYFLIHQDLTEIEKEALPIKGVRRPMVLMQDVYEAIEHCLFFYERGILPLIGEVFNPAVVSATAQQYRIDSLVIDSQSTADFRQELLKLNLPLKAVTVVDSAFNANDFKWPKGIKVYCILSLPEFGRIAYGCPEALLKKITFHPYEDILIEPAKFAILTSVRLRSCPMIRYQSDLSLKKVESRCSCGQPSFLLH
ncbi:hypothetical protein HYT17_01590 [Candidatus Microgenomates bacterium]|nr:hypothetical protein [Candidatus Microgenomates bacterium]